MTGKGETKLTFADTEDKDTESLQVGREPLQWFQNILQKAKQFQRWGKCEAAKYSILKRYH